MAEIFYKDIVRENIPEATIEIMSGVFYDADLDEYKNNIGRSDSLTLTTTNLGAGIVTLFDYNLRVPFTNLAPIEGITSNKQSVPMRVGFSIPLLVDTLEWTADENNANIGIYTETVIIQAKDNTPGTPQLSPELSLDIAIKNNLPTFKIKIDGSAISNNNITIENVGDTFYVEVYNLDDVEDGADFLGVTAITGGDYIDLDKHLKLSHIQTELGAGSKPAIDPSFNLPGFSVAISDAGYVGSSDPDYSVKVTYTATDISAIEPGSYAIEVYDAVGGLRESPPFTIITGDNVPVGVLLTSIEHLTVSDYGGDPITIPGLDSADYARIENDADLLIPYSITIPNGVSSLNYMINCEQDYGGTYYRPFSIIELWEQVDEGGERYAKKSLAVGQPFAGSFVANTIKGFLVLKIDANWNGLFDLVFTIFNVDGGGSNIVPIPVFSISSIEQAPTLLI